MDLLYNVLVFIHLLGMAGIVGGVMVQLASARGGPHTVGCAGLQLITGLALVGIASAGLVSQDVNNTKIAVKLVIALAVLVLALLSKQRRGMVLAVGGLTVVNVGIAAIW